MSCPAITTETRRRGRPRKYSIATRSEDRGPNREPAIPLDWGDAPAVMIATDAARVLRISKSAVLELVTQHRYQAENGCRPRNPIPAMRAGRLIRFDRELLRDWFRRECSGYASDAGAEVETEVGTEAGVEP